MIRINCSVTNGVCLFCTFSRVKGECVASCLLERGGGESDPFKLRVLSFSQGIMLVSLPLYDE